MRNRMNESNHLCSTSFLTFSWKRNHTTFHSDFSETDITPIEGLLPLGCCGCCCRCCCWDPVGVVGFFLRPKQQQYDFGHSGSSLWRAALDVNEEGFEAMTVILDWFENMDGVGDKAWSLMLLLLLLLSLFPLPLFIDGEASSTNDEAMVSLLLVALVMLQLF